MPVFFCKDHGTFGAGSTLCACLKKQLKEEQEEMRRAIPTGGERLETFANYAMKPTLEEALEALSKQKEVNRALNKLVGQDKLSTMFEVQARFQMRVGAPSGTEDRMQYITEQTLAAMVELGEFMQELPWKSWKAYNPDEIDLDKAVEELVDVQHFVINLALALDLSATEFYYQFMQKNATNSKRQDDGYGGEKK